MNAKLFALLVLIAILALVILFPDVHVWEDGSFGIGSFPYPVSGCLPWGVCN